MNLNGIGEETIRTMALDCLVDGVHGVHVPRTFCEELWGSGVTPAECNLDLQDFFIVLKGDKVPSEEYWEAWDYILIDFEYEDNAHHVHRLYPGENGDLFLADITLIELWEVANNTEFDW